MHEQHNQPPEQSMPQGQLPSPEEADRQGGGLGAYLRLGVIIAGLGVQAMVSMGKRELSPEERKAAADLQKVLDAYDAADDAGKEKMRKKLNTGLTHSEIRDAAGNN